MAERYPGWTSGMDAEDARFAAAALLTPGASAAQVRSGFKPGPGTPGRVTATAAGPLQVHPFQAAVQDARSAVGAAFLVTLDSPKLVDLLRDQPADQTNPRIDVIAAVVKNPAPDAPNGFVVTVVPGSATPNPVAPAVPTNAIRLADIRVEPGATQITQDKITDRAVEFGFTCSVGGILPTSARPANPYPGMYIHNLASRALEMWDGSAWRTFAPFDDTGWQQVTVATGWEAFPDVTSPQAPSRVEVRRIGRTVFLRGVVRRASDTAGSTLGTLPPGFMPSFSRPWLSTAQSGGREIMVTLVLRQVFISFPRATLDRVLVHHVQGTWLLGDWIPLDTSWLID